MISRGWPGSAIECLKSVAGRKPESGRLAQCGGFISKGFPASAIECLTERNVKEAAADLEKAKVEVNAALLDLVHTGCKTYTRDELKEYPRLLRQCAELGYYAD